MERYAYIRVSSKDQSIRRQRAALEPYRIPEKNIFCDHQSGKDFDRPQYRKLVERLQQGDLLIVKSIDRLGRNYNDILSQWQHITKELGADILVLDMELLDTRKKAGNLTGTLIADLVLQIFAYVAQTERELIRQRQAEGIAAAKRTGKKFGRPQYALPPDFPKVCEICYRGELSTRVAAEMLGMTHSTFYRHYRKETEKLVSKGRQFGTQAKDMG
ncbi:MAG: recombinase family protein [Clostridia bacterium]|nr:recombinase family protein [Clostridia bacterium]